MSARKQAKRIVGKVTRWSDYQGYGFIEDSAKKNYYVHVSFLQMQGLKTLEEGQRVEFLPHPKKPNYEARDVRPITDEAEPKPKDNSWFFLKKNPFTPQDPVIDPRKFAGRKGPFRSAVDSIYNQKNILISGHRGIGKSSLAYQLLYMTQGEMELVKKLEVDLVGESFKRASGSHVCVPGNTLLDVANGLVSSLAAALKKKKISGDAAKLSFNLKFFTAEFTESYERYRPTDLSLKFVQEVEELFAQVDHLHDGFSFLIDEIDVLEKNQDVAPFLKATIEKLRLDGFGNICFIISGVTGTATDLLAQHPSSSRLFEHLQLEKMSDDELSEVIAVCLYETGVKIDDLAQTQIIHLSNRFPQPVHLLGYHAFRLDSNGVIELSDIEKAQDFIVQNLKKQDFQLTFEGIKNAAMTEVIRAIAASRFDTVEPAYLIKNLRGLSKDAIFGNLGRLEEKGVIEVHTRGVYRFKDPLFKIYLQWVFGIRRA